MDFCGTLANESHSINTDQNHCHTLYDFWLFKIAQVTLCMQFEKWWCHRVIAIIYKYVF